MIWHRVPAAAPVAAVRCSRPSPLPLPPGHALALLRLAVCGNRFAAIPLGRARGRPLKQGGECRAVSASGRTSGQGRRRRARHTVEWNGVCNEPIIGGRRMQVAVRCLWGRRAGQQATARRRGEERGGQGQAAGKVHRNVGVV